MTEKDDNNEENVDANKKETNDERKVQHYETRQAVMGKKIPIKTRHVEDDGKKTNTNGKTTEKTMKSTESEKINHKGEEGKKKGKKIKRRKYEKSRSAMKPFVSIMTLICHVLITLAVV